MDVKKKTQIVSLTYFFFKNNLYGQKGVSQAFALGAFPIGS